MVTALGMIYLVDSIDDAHQFIRQNFTYNNAKLYFINKQDRVIYEKNNVNQLVKTNDFDEYIGQTVKMDDKSEDVTFASILNGFVEQPTTNNILSNNNDEEKKYFPKIIKFNDGKEIVINNIGELLNQFENVFKQLYDTNGKVEQIIKYLQSNVK